MGIPSYFSYIVKNHSDIIRKLNKDTLKKIGGKIDNLYLDSNSIIYDCFYQLVEKYTNANATNTNPTTSLPKEGIEQVLIKELCVTIETYIKQIRPVNKVIIAFDGVAPVAKLEQQRNRRYKSYFMRKLEQQYNQTQDKPKSNVISWSTSNITPGTQFMNTMSDHINMYFNQHKTKELGLKTIIVSSSKTEGEGEHKIFQYIRDYPEYHKKTTTVVYGLDADLIMLTLNHLSVSNQLYLFRETPHFIRQIDSSLDPNMTYMMDIPRLGTIIAEKLSGRNTISNKTKNNKKKQTPNTSLTNQDILHLVNDYILICFLLGNDFMPHFPGLNIRTNGIQHMMEAYTETVGRFNYHLSKDGVIHWKNIRRFIGYLAEREDQYIKKEYNIREKWERNNRNNRNNRNTKENNSMQEKLLSIPTKKREKEKYIDPSKYGWEKRYYNVLFQIDIDDMRLKQICKNFLEALEWTYKYYNTGCCDWRWHYHYNYPPLLKDLIKYIPYFDTEFVVEKPKFPVSPYTQLSYVLPRSSLNLLPPYIEKMLVKKHSKDWYNNLDITFEWSFCKYFWESHVCLPPISLDILEKEIEICVKQEKIKNTNIFLPSYVHAT
jgi:5'-3' exonuclease